MIFKRGGWPFPNLPQGPFQLNRASPQVQSLVGWWPFVAMSTREWVRGTGGSLQNNAVFGIGTYGRGLILPGGNNDRYTISSSYLRPSNFSQISLAVWFRYTAGNTLQAIINYRQNTDNNYNIHLNGANDASAVVESNIELSTNSVGRATSSSVCTAGKLHHVVITCDGTSMSIYLDGIGVATGGGGNQTGDLGSFYIGDTHSFLSHEMSGDVYDVRIYDCILPAAQVYALYDPQTRWELYQPLPKLWAVGQPTTPQTVSMSADMQLSSSYQSFHISSLTSIESLTNETYIDTSLVKADLKTSTLDLLSILRQVKDNIFYFVSIQGRLKNFVLDLVSVQRVTSVSDYDLIAKRSKTKEHTSALISKLLHTTTYLIDLVTKTANNIFYTTDFVIKGTRVAESLLDVLLQKTITADHLLDMYLSTEITKNYWVYVIAKQAKNLLYTSSLVLNEVLRLNSSIDFRLRKLQTYMLSFDIRKIATKTSNHLVNLFVQKQGVLQQLIYLTMRAIVQRTTSSYINTVKREGLNAVTDLVRTRQDVAVHDIDVGAVKGEQALEVVDIRSVVDRTTESIYELFLTASVSRTRLSIHDLLLIKTLALITGYHVRIVGSQTSTYTIDIAVGARIGLGPFVNLTGEFNTSMSLLGEHELERSLEGEHVHGRSLEGYFGESS